jgi:hypothetical protein
VSDTRAFLGYPVVDPVCTISTRMRRLSSEGGHDGGDALATVDSAARPTAGHAFRNYTVRREREA